MKENDYLDYKNVYSNLIENVDEVLNDISRVYAGYTFEKAPIELIDYHEKCPVN